jgi:hypothetical protein
LCYFAAHGREGEGRKEIVNERPEGKEKREKEETTGTCMFAYYLPPPPPPYPLSLFSSSHPEFNFVACKVCNIPRGALPKVVVSVV